MKDEVFLRNKHLNKKSKISVISVRASEETNIENSKKLQKQFKYSIKNKKYKNKATGFVASITSETKGKIIRPNGNKTNIISKNYILRMIAANNLTRLFKNAIYIDTLPAMKGKEKNENELGYHHFVAPIKINGNIYRALITSKEKQNSKKLYSLNIEIIPQKNGNVPLANTKSKYQLRRTFPCRINISDLVNNVKIYNYNLNVWQLYGVDDVKYKKND